MEVFSCSAKTGFKTCYALRCAVCAFQVRFIQIFKALREVRNIFTSFGALIVKEKTFKLSQQENDAYVFTLTHLKQKTLFFL